MPRCLLPWLPGTRGAIIWHVPALSLGYGIGSLIVNVAMPSLPLNLALAGLFVLIGRELIEGVAVAPTDRGVDAQVPSRPPR